MTRTLLASVLLIGCGSTDATMSREAQLASPLCQAKDAKSAFGSNAVCVCDDLELVGAGFVARGVGANVGVNGVSHVVGLHDIGGSLIAMKGITGVGQVSTGANLSTTGDIAGVGHVTVGKDLMVGGRVASVGVLEVGGTLGVQGEATLIGLQQVGARGAYAAPAEPCGCGAPSVDIAARIADAKANGTRLGDTRAVGDTSLTLKSGTYYADSLASVGRLKVIVDGAVALAIGADLETVGQQHIELTGGSTLDLYVAGSLASVGDSVFGGGASPGSVRVFLGGAQRQSLAVGAQRLNASIYAPRAELAVVGDTTVNGSIFAKALTGVGRLTVDYAAPAAATPVKCVVDDPKGGGSNNGGGGNPDDTPTPM